MKKHIPNIITCLNLFSGCIACVMAFNSDFKFALYFIILAAIFDFFDGFTARLLKAYSPIGKELDSLADVISFGIAPGIMVFSYLNANNIFESNQFASFIPYIAFLIPVFSALRLAKFNIDERQTSSFIGLPTPANALFWSAAFYNTNILSWNPYLTEILILILIIAFCLLMISEMPMFSLKFKHFKLKGNEHRYLIIILTIIFFIIFNFSGISISILTYIFLSLFFKK